MAKGDNVRVSAGGDSASLIAERRGRYLETKLTAAWYLVTEYTQGGRATGRRLLARPALLETVVEELTPRGAKAGKRK